MIPYTTTTVLGDAVMEEEERLLEDAVFRCSSLWFRILVLFVRWSSRLLNSLLSEEDTSRNKDELMNSSSIICNLLFSLRIEEILAQSMFKLSRAFEKAPKATCEGRVRQLSS